MEIQSKHPPNELWYCLNMDIHGISKMSMSGNKYILVIIDKLTRFCILEAMPNQEAEMVLKKFIANMLQLGLPRHVFTDQGTQFTLRLAEGLVKTFRMNCVYTSKFNPRSDGQTENLNRTVLNTFFFSVCRVFHPMTPGPGGRLWRHTTEPSPSEPMSHNRHQAVTSGSGNCLP